MKRALGTLLGVLALVFFAEANGAVPTTVNFTGRLTGSSGPVNGTVDGVFAIFNAPTGGNLVWTEARSLNVDMGLVFVDLGSVTPLDATIFDGQSPLYLQVTINGEVLSPRMVITSVPYSTTAGTSESLGTIAPGDVVTTVNGGGGVDAVRDMNTVNVGLTTCASGQILKAGAGGVWACATDNDTTYGGTSPITVAGTTISLAAEGVTASHIAASAVTNTEIADSAVTLRKLRLPGATAMLAQVMSASGVISPAAATITPEAAGFCLVTSHLSTSESGATGNVDVQVTRGTSLFGPEQALTTAPGTTRYSAGVTAVVPVVAATSQALGCDVDISSGSSFLGNSFTCTVSFVCFS